MESRRKEEAIEDEIHLEEKLEVVDRNFVKVRMLWLNTKQDENSLSLTCILAGKLQYIHIDLN